MCNHNLSLSCPLFLSVPASEVAQPLSLTTHRAYILWPRYPPVFFNKSAVLYIGVELRQVPESEKDDGHMHARTHAHTSDDGLGPRDTGHS